MKQVIDFLSQHLIFAALLVSALWFYGGRQFQSEGKPVVGLGWQAIGVATLAAFCVQALRNGLWLSLVIALSALALELAIVRRYWAQKKNPRSSAQIRG